MPGDPVKDFGTVLQRHGYTATKKIGEGSFGVAVLTEDAEGHQNVCKMVNVSKAGEKEKNEARKEARLLAQLKHPYIVRYRENFYERGWLCIVMDFCDGGDVAAQIDKAKARKTNIPEASIQRWITQAMLALKYLHDKHVLHRDLKPSNLFLTRDGDLRVGDFGISKALEGTGAYARTFVGTPYYISPEVIQEKPYSWGADVWSMGCILYQLCAKQVPWDAKNIKELARKICASPIPQVPEGYSEEVRRLCTDMMRRNPRDRATVDDVVNNDLIQAVVKKLLTEKRERAAAKPQGPAEEQDQDENAPQSVKHEILDQFNRFDRNGDGVVDRAELSAVLKHLDKEVWTDERIDHVLEIADTNKDGRIQFDEFVRWIFGGGGEVGQVELIRQMIDLALKAAKDGDVAALDEILLRWRQAADVGCIRVSDPDTCIKCCGALEVLGGGSAQYIDAASDTAALEIARHMVAILDSMSRVLAECSRRHVVRVAGVSSRTGLRGLIFELADGTRVGSAPGGLTDLGIEAAGAKWEDLAEGERVVEVRGYAYSAAASPAMPAAARPQGGRGRSPPPSRRPSPPPSSRPTPADDSDILASGVVLYTNRSRHFSFGGGMNRGAVFGFRAAEGHEIDEVQFKDKTCVGICESDYAVNWPPERLQAAREAFQSAVEAVCPLMLRLSSKAGPAYGKYALLQARQLGFSKPMDLENVEAQLAARAAAISPPTNWRVSAMPCPEPEKWLAPEAAVGQVQLSESEIAMVQALVTASCVFKGKRDPATAKAPFDIELLSGVRIQSWREWVAFAAKAEAIRADMQSDPGDQEEGQEEDGHQEEGHPRLKTSGYRLMGIDLEADINCVWLFHHVDAKVAREMPVKQLVHGTLEERVIGDELLYGRGLYFNESCTAADQFAADSAGSVRFMLLCRVILGRVLHDDALLPDVSRLVGECVGGSHHSVIGDREKHWPDTAHREFVVYDSDQMYPEFLLLYRRAYR